MLRRLLHLRGLVLDLIVHVLNYGLLVLVVSFLMNQLLELANIFLVEVNLALHILQVTGNALDFAFPASILRLSLLLFFINLLAHFTRLPLVDVGNLTVLVFDYGCRLMLDPVLLSELSLDF